MSIKVQPTNNINNKVGGLNETGRKNGEGLDDDDPLDSSNVDNDEDNDKSNDSDDDSDEPTNNGVEEHQPNNQVDDNGPTPVTKVSIQNNRTVLQESFASQSCVSTDNEWCKKAKDYFLTTAFKYLKFIDCEEMLEFGEKLCMSVLKTVELPKEIVPSSGQKLTPEQQEANTKAMEERKQYWNNIKPSLHKQLNKMRGNRNGCMKSALNSMYC